MKPKFKKFRVLDTKTSVCGQRCHKALEERGSHPPDFPYQWPVVACRPEHGRTREEQRARERIRNKIPGQTCGMQMHWDSKTASPFIRGTSQPSSP